MKKLPLPTIDDFSIIGILADNVNLNRTSYPHLKNQLAVIQSAYSNYHQSNGNPWIVGPCTISNELEIALKKHYKSPPQEVSFIKKIRNSSPDVCPMCGGFHPTTVDHYLPKESYPAWSIYSRNLVPACSCNSFRGSAIKGNLGTGARILHPYYDEFLDQRLYSTSISYDVNFEWLEAEMICLDPNHPNIDSLQYHLKSVIIRVKVKSWLDSQMNKLMERPSNVIKNLPRRRRINIGQLQEHLLDYLDICDDSHRTKNNWESILIHGILNKDCIHEWLLERHNETLS